MDEESVQVDDVVEVEPTPAEEFPDEPGAVVEERPSDAPFGGIEVPHTGDERVDEVLAGLLDLAGAPVAGHVAIYDAVHRGLRDSLADLEPAPSPAVRR